MACQNLNAQSAQYEMLGSVAVKEVLLALIFVQLCNSDTDGQKWVWGDARRRSDDGKLYTGSISNDRKYTGQLGGAAKPLFQPSSTFGGDFQYVPYLIFYVN